jgi:hypothetical protein
LPQIDIVREARERLEAAWLQDRENREDAFTDLKFLAGDQWPAAVRQQREAQSRPCLTINRLPQFVHQVANSVRMNPPQIKAIPAGGEATEALAEIYSGLFRHIQYRSNATHVFAHAVHYAVACGIGHFRLATDYVDDNAFEQEILVRRIQHPLSVFWDPAAIEPSRADADYCLVSEMIGKKEFEARFPHAAATDFDTPRRASKSGKTRAPRRSPSRRSAPTSTSAASRSTRSRAWRIRFFSWTITASSGNSTARSRSASPRTPSSAP